MTDAWGAVVAAVAAGVFGVGGALVGVFVGRKQTTDQAYVEHEQWLRGQRREAYVAYLAAFDDARSKVEDVVRFLPRHIDPASYDEGQFEQQRRSFFATEIGEAMFPTLAAFEAVKLLGPDGVARAAEEMNERLDQLAGDVAGYGLHASSADDCAARQSAFNSTSFDAYRLRQSFFEAAREVMMRAPKPGT